MDLQIKEKLALVTGSTSGIGKAIAVKLLQEGANVIINGRSQERIDVVVQELQAFGTVYGVTADIATAAGTEHLVKAAHATGDVDILINNVGFFEFRPFFQITDAEWIVAESNAHAKNARTELGEDCFHRQ
jgi:NADP-dependent 3-hydroxy acid dehydrogenase YdfG